MEIAKVQNRESSFELIRVLAQYFIVLYHILLVIVYENTGISFYKAIWLPLHIGVPLFVMISGYFGIKTDVRRLVKLVGMVFVLQVPLLLADTAVGGGNLKDYVLRLFFISNTPFWFIRTYLYLFLFAPVINLYLRNCTLRQRVLLLLVLLFMSIYIGTLKFDSSLENGKNLVSFLFFYVVGNTLHVYKDMWQSIHRKYLAVVWVITNAFLVAFFTYFGDNRYAVIAFGRLFFEYTSIGLLLNSVLFFMMIGGLNIRSKLVNRIGKSSLAIYMLHGTPLVIFGLLPPCVMWLYSLADDNILLVMMFLMLLTGIIVIVCWLVYEALNPVWRLIDKVGVYAQRKFNLIENRLVKS